MDHSKQLAESSQLCNLPNIILGSHIIAQDSVCAGHYALELTISRRYGKSNDSWWLLDCGSHAPALAHIKTALHSFRQEIILPHLGNHRDKVNSSNI